jgi:hypothetical protein
MDRAGRTTPRGMLAVAKKACQYSARLMFRKLLSLVGHIVGEACTRLHWALACAVAYRVGSQFPAIA